MLPGMQFDQQDKEYERARLKRLEQRRAGATTATAKPALHNDYATMEGGVIGRLATISADSTSKIPVTGRLATTSADSTYMIPVTQTQANSTSADSTEQYRSYKDVKVGDRVTVSKYEGAGVVRYVGVVHTDGVRRVGVEFDKPVGRHNGTVKGHQYFKCPSQHGVLVVFSKVKLLAPHAPPRSASVWGFGASTEPSYDVPAWDNDFDASTLARRADEATKFLLQLSGPKKGDGVGISDDELDDDINC